MKKLIVPSGNYTFDVTAKTITVSGTDYTPFFNEEYLLLVTNITRNVIIYNPYCDGYGGTLSGAVLTLEASLSGYDNADDLQIILFVPDSYTSPSYVSLSPTDDWTIDAFGNKRISETSTRLDVEFIYDKQEEIIDEKVITGGTVTHNTDSRDLTLAINNTTTATEATMSSYPVPYTPGNSQKIDVTGTLNTAALEGGTVSLFLRSNVTGSVVEEEYEQGNWLFDNVTDQDWTKSFILQMDFQSLKVGRIRYFMVRDGIPVKLHEIVNDNKYAGGYWQNPTQPLYWRIYNDATYTYCEMGYGDESNGIGIRYKVAKNASATMRAICGTVKSEGGADLLDIPGFPRATDGNGATKTISTTLIPIISIRPKSTFQSLHNHNLIIPTGFSLSTDNAIRFVLVHDAVLDAGTVSWVDVDTTQSSVEYDISAASFTNGHIIDIDYVNTTKNTQAGDKGLLDKTVLWHRESGESGVITLAAIRTKTSNATVRAALKWKEIR